MYGVRPEYLTYSAGPAEGAFGGQVAIVENLGASHLATLDVNDVSVQVVVPEGSEPAVGDDGYAVPRRDRALVYRNGELV
ncbi:TOBE domain-containing protein [Nonomuraea thailandensis]